jgi:hypothetical protein
MPASLGRSEAADLGERNPEPPTAVEHKKASYAKLRLDIVVKVI